MEAASIPETSAGAPPRNPIARRLSDNLLWVLLAVALIYFFAQDPKALPDIMEFLSAT